jgi:hypothetical protein
MPVTCVTALLAAHACAQRWQAHLLHSGTIAEPASFQLCSNGFPAPADLDLTCVCTAQVVSSTRVAATGVGLPQTGATAAFAVL